MAVLFYFVLHSCALSVITLSLDYTQLSLQPAMFYRIQLNGIFISF